MSNLTLSFISAGIYESIAPLLSGAIQPEGIELLATYSDPSETFLRQLKFAEFEISALSMSSYLIAKSSGMDMVAIPVFFGRRFMHSELSCHVDSRIKEPKDIIGKRIGVGEYQQTASLWVRGLLEHDFGVSQYKIHWYMERSEELSHGGATGFTPPDGISFSRIPADKSLASMLVNNEIDVASVQRAFMRESNIVDRSTQIRAKGGDWSKVKPLFVDRIAEGARFFKKYGYIPASHFYIVRGDIHQKYPWVAGSLYRAFVAAKEWADQRLVQSLPVGLVFGEEYLQRTREIFGADPFPYGVKANRRMLETIIGYSYEQGLTQHKLAVEDLFAPETLDT